MPGRLPADRIPWRCAWEGFVNGGGLCLREPACSLPSPAYLSESRKGLCSVLHLAPRPGGVGGRGSAQPPEGSPCSEPGCCPGRPCCNSERRVTLAPGPMHVSLSASSYQKLCGHFCFRESGPAQGGVSFSASPLHLVTHQGCVCRWLGHPSSERLSRCPGITEIDYMHGKSWVL